MRPSILASLLLVLLPSVARAALSPLDGGASPEGAAIFDTDPFGSFDPTTSTFDPTDPADATMTLGALTFCSGSSSSIYELSTTPPQRIVLRDASYESTSWGFYLDATNPALYDPTQDTATASTRVSTFHVATTGALAALTVQLSQSAQGTTLTEVYTLTNQGAATLSLRFANVTDTDIGVGPGASANWAAHDTRWPGAGLPASVAATITDSLQLTALTVALQGGVPEGWRTIRANAPGWELYRVPNLYSYYDPSFLNGLFTFPAASFGNGSTRPFTDEIADGTLGTGFSDAEGDIAMGLQTNLMLAPGQSSTVTVTFTLFSGGPYLVAPSCPLPDMPVMTPVDVPLVAEGAFGATTFSVASGALPAGVAQTNGALVGTPTTLGTATFVLKATDERGRAGLVPCSVDVVDYCAGQKDGAACGTAEPCATQACFGGTCIATSAPDGALCTLAGEPGVCIAGTCLVGSAPQSASSTSSSGSGGGAGTGGEGGKGGAAASTTSATSTTGAGTGGAASAATAGAGGSGGATITLQGGGTCGASRVPTGGDGSVVAAAIALGMAARRRRSARVNPRSAPGSRVC